MSPVCLETKKRSTFSTRDQELSILLQTHRHRTWLRYLHNPCADTKQQNSHHTRYVLIADVQLVYELVVIMVLQIVIPAHGVSLCYE